MGTKEENCVITPPKFGVVDLYIEGIAPLVVERFSNWAYMNARDSIFARGEREDI